MDDKARVERNAYMRAWRKRNKDKVQAAQKRYWEKRSRINNKGENKVCMI